MKLIIFYRDLMHWLPSTEKSIEHVQRTKLEWIRVCGERVLTHITLLGGLEMRQYLILCKHGLVIKRHFLNERYI